MTTTEALTLADKRFIRDLVKVELRALSIQLSVVLLIAGCIAGGAFYNAINETNARLDRQDAAIAGVHKQLGEAIGASAPDTAGRTSPRP